MGHRTGHHQAKDGVVPSAGDVEVLVAEDCLSGEVGQRADDGARDGLGGDRAGLEEAEVGASCSDSERSGLHWGRRMNHGDRDEVEAT